MDYLSEFIGTLILILFGNSVVYTVISGKTPKSYTVAVLGWGLAVMVAAILAMAMGGPAHLNPAVTIANMFNSNLAVGVGFAYMGLQLAGAMVGQVVTNLIHYPTIKEIQTLSQHAHATHSWRRGTTVAPFANEFVATTVFLAVLTFGIQALATHGMNQWMGPMVAELTVAAVGFSFGTITTWSINPARDLGPRIVYYFTHKLLKLNGEAFHETQFEYAWIPVVAPICAGLFIGVMQYI